ncbi:MAG TPA: hypothetical protein VII42_09520 [Caulobacteraceae bacterium]|jgi:hypothetical protein
MTYALVAAVLWGVLTHFLHAPLWLLIVGALLIVGGGFWLERERLIRSAPANRQTFFVVLAAAYAFVAIVTTALVATISALVPIVLHR